MKNVAKALIIAALAVTSTTAHARLSPGERYGYMNNNGFQDFGFCSFSLMLGNGGYLNKPCFLFN